MLKKLYDANVPVLWRPFHEMNGIWFWWGNRPGEGGIKELWKIMYYRYTDHHRLNNLIWVWNHNTPEQVRELYESPRVVTLGDTLIW